MICFLCQGKIWHGWNLGASSNGIEHCILHGQLLWDEKNHNQLSADGEYLSNYFQSKLEVFTIFLIYFQWKLEAFTKLHPDVFVQLLIYHHSKSENLEKLLVEENIILLETVTDHGNNFLSEA
jgi:hypothetical protein